MRQKANSSGPRSTQRARKSARSRANHCSEKIAVASLKQRFFEAADRTSDFGPSWVHVSYKEFVGYFRSIPKKKPLTHHNFIVGAYFSYGWMPTMLRLGDNISAALKAINKARSSTRDISEKEFLEIAAVINRSVVGASKLLHFICPNKYAIWDSRVYRFIFKEEPSTHRLSKPRAYQDYLDALRVLTKNSSFQRAKVSVVKAVGYRITDLRACELVMFANGKKKKQKRSKPNA
jgi:hypothetical protein